MEGEENECVCVCVHMCEHIRPLSEVKEKGEHGFKDDLNGPEHDTIDKDERPRTPIPFCTANAHITRRMLQLSQTLSKPSYATGWFLLHQPQKLRSWSLPSSRLKILWRGIFAFDFRSQFLTMLFHSN